MTSKGLHNTSPRETGGSIAGDRLDYQYQRAAEACLSLLEDADTFCVLLEWHDDFVSEKKSGTNVLYGFSQVKTRTPSEGPWKIAQVFGLPRSLTKPASPSIASKLFEHFITFEKLCSEVVLITNTGIDGELEKLVNDVARVSAPSDLDDTSKKNFDKIITQWGLPEAPTHGRTETEIFHFISLIKLKPEAARINQSSIDYRGTLSELIFKFSEIDLTTSQAGAICSELLVLVKEKSNDLIEKKHIPMSPELLRKRKGILVSDLLPLLSLSNDAYLELRRSGIPVIKTLSRLQRVCSSSGLNAEQTVAVCRLKCDWDVWYFDHRSNFQDSDLMLLRGECAGVLDSYIKTNGKFDQLVRDAESIAKRYEPKLPVRGFNTDLAMGLVFAIAAERGPSLGTL